MQSILLIEDDESIRDVLALHLEGEGFQLDWEQDGETGAARAVTGSHVLVILDVQLPRLGGVEACRRIRKARPSLPIIMLTSRDTELDKVLGLDAGADDYVTKPFGIYELLARIRSRLRASAAVQSESPETAEPATDIMVRGPLVIDLGRRAVTLSNRPIELTVMEFDLLAFLAAHQGRPFTREALLFGVWGVTAFGYEDNVSQLISRLRKKIESDVSNPVFVRTVRGIGYCFAERPGLETASTDDGPAEGAATPGTRLDGES
jgi:DNA-binding response OmpR family regulator